MFKWKFWNSESQNIGPISHTIPLYRIIPYSVTQWKVEQQIYVDGDWEDTYHYLSSGTKFQYETEKEAENFIDKRISERKEELEKKRITAERIANIPPRGYP